IQMAYLAVAHLSFRKTDVGPAGVDERVGILAKQAVVVRLACQRDGIGLPLSTVAPAVKNCQDQWLGTIRHAFSLSYGRTLSLCLCSSRQLSVEIESLNAEEARRLAEFFLDAQQLVVFGDTIGPRSRPGLDLSRPGGHGKVGDEGVLRLAGTV